MQLAVPFTLSLAAAAFGQNFETTVTPFLKKNCVGCHNASLKTAGLDLQKAAPADRNIWERVAEKLKTGDMPPASVPRPAQEQIAAVVAWADRHVDALDRKRKIDPGRVTARRLNRAEYNNTIRDLLGVAFRPADDFPLDDSGYGFDNIGDVLSVNPTLTEKYLKAADQIVKAAIVTDAPRKTLYARIELEKVGEPQQMPADPEAERLVRRASLIARHDFPAYGEYEIRILVRGRGIPQSPNSKLALLVDGKQVAVHEVEVGDDKKRAFEMKRRFAAGESEIGAAWVFPGPMSYKHPNPEKKELADFLNVDAIEIRGPYAAPLPETHTRILTCAETEPDCARKIVSSFARRAWRRPVTAEEVAKLLRFVEMARKEGDRFEQGIALALKAALVSPNFLFRIEHDSKTGAPHAINDFELASRMSYFLWSSMPDEELLRLAGENKLREPAAMAAQVKRMLADPKADALAENFAGQWLELRNLNALSPDPKKFPQWDSDLREAMRRETNLYFAAMLREDRGILEFLDGKFTFVNERLAKHYGLGGVEGRKFRRVPLDGAQRSGVLTQASILAVTAYPTRTSPVLRGLWVMENFLASPPPAPPANVPKLKEEAIGKTASLRKQLEQHRADPNCAVCHVKMDQLGFGLENYDSIGGWRTHDGDFAIDAMGVLPGNKTFATPAEMKKVLLDEKDAFVRCLTEKLMIYGLGRGLEDYDKPAVRSIGQKVAANGYRFSSMIVEIMRSPAFRMRRGEAATLRGNTL